MNVLEVKSQKRARDAHLEMQLRVPVRISDVYYFSDDASEAKDIFINPLTQERETRDHFPGEWIIEVRYLDGVSDPAEDSILKALHDRGIECTAARSALRYYLTTQDETLVRKAAQHIANELVHKTSIGHEKLAYEQPHYSSGSINNTVEEIPITTLGDSQLSAVGNTLSLNLQEMKTIQAHFKQLNREPRDAEIETLAQTWSEHCKHKTFNSAISGERAYSNLFKETIVAATNAIKKDWLVSVFKDNAGIIKFDDKNHFAFKVETHNHPSALDPYGGASTGVGGVIRDVLGAGKGGTPLFNTDVLCFAPPTMNAPTGILQPERIMKGVVQGVQEYGNNIGIPTVNGAVIFHKDYLGAPLVYCGTGGLIPVGKEHKQVEEGDRIIVVGGKTGRDGLHGATFSSSELTSDQSTSVVQIGNPIEEKKVLDFLIKARDENLYNSVTDCGAGGFSSAVGEMGEEGASVELSRVALKHSNMKPWEIWLSESQERMVLSAPPENVAQLKELAAIYDVSVTDIGEFNNSGTLSVSCEGKEVVELDMGFLHKGLPHTAREATYETEEESTLHLPAIDHSSTLKKLLSHPTIASKETIIRRYDHEVQGNTIAGPLIGDAVRDAAIIQPFESNRALVIANGINPLYKDSYHMASNTIDEAMRNIVAAGGNPDYVALLDNFCWGNTDKPEKLGSLVRAAEACKDFAIAYQTPFISGKDSLHNEFKTEEGTIAIPDTLLISAVSVIDANQKRAASTFKKGQSVYIIGETKEELRGSHLSDVLDINGGSDPKVENSIETYRTVHELIKKGLIESIHDLSEGGLAVAAAEMCFGGVGATIDTTKVHTDENVALYSESAGRFLAAIDPQNEKYMIGTKIGTTGGNELIINHHRELIQENIQTLLEEWKVLQW